MKRSFQLLALAALWSVLAAASTFDADLAKRLGADAQGMRHYVLVVLKSGPTPVTDKAKRAEMFKGHFANMERLAAAGKLAVAGPLDGVDGWRGLFVFAVESIDEAKQLTASDPVLQNGEMVAEYHKFFSSAALMVVNETHAKLSATPN
ncbi:MAG TPA: YciI family protein [Steroidobacteraceae bacterium]|nr:YciI family protein [Steroidobacteraceae bacterium]